MNCPNFLIVAGMALVLSSCQAAKWAVIKPTENLAHIEWTAEELQQDTVLRTLEATSHASYHIIRLNKSEPAACA